MSNPILERLPKEALEQPSIQHYDKVCQDQLLAVSGDFQAKFQVEKTQATNRVKGDGEFLLLNNDTSHDFFCAGRVSGESRELDIVTGRLSEKQPTQADVLVMKDHCSLTEATFGPEEFLGGSCTDGVISAELQEAYDSGNYPSLDLIDQFCTEQLQRHMQKFRGSYHGRSFSMSQAQIFHPNKKSPFYQVRYHSVGNQFLCEGTVDPDGRVLQLQGGALQWDGDGKESFKMGVGKKGYRMDDACGLTSTLIGAEMLLDGCEDIGEEQKKSEATMDRLAEVLILGGVTALPIAWWAKKGMPIAFHLYSRKQATTYLMRPWLGRALPLLGGAIIGDRIYEAFLSEHFEKGSTEDKAARVASWVGGGAGGKYIASRLASGGSVLGSAITRRAAGSRLGTALLGGARWTVRGASLAGLIGTVALDQGIRHLVVAGDYDADVNTMVTDIIYDENVYQLDAWDLLGVPLALKGIRASTRFIVPSALEWSVATSRSGIGSGKFGGEVKDEILAEHREGSREILKLMQDPSMAQILLDPTKELEENLAVLKEPVEPNSILASYLALHNYDLEKVRKDFVDGDIMSETEFDQAVFDLDIHNFQQMAADLVYVDQPLNDWAREIFYADGTLKAGQEQALNAKLKLTANFNTYAMR